jgi:hypothetical protein
MSRAEQLGLAFDASPADEPARVPRRERVRLVELTPFPRRSREEGTFHGFSRNDSECGICVVTEQATAVGALLRVVVRGIDGRAEQRRVARVIWTAPHDDRRQRLGLAFIADEAQIRRMRTVRPVARLRVPRGQEARTGSG